MRGAAKGKRAEWFVMDLLGCGSAPLGEVVGAPERRITAAYANSGQARIKLVGAAVHDAGERTTAGINEDLRGIETGVLNGNKRLVTGEAEASLIQNAR